MELTISRAELEYLKSITGSDLEKYLVDEFYNCSEEFNDAESDRWFIEDDDFTANDVHTRNFTVSVEDYRIHIQNDKLMLRGTAKATYTVVGIYKYCNDDGYIDTIEVGEEESAATFIFAINVDKACFDASILEVKDVEPYDPYVDVTLA